MGKVPGSAGTWAEGVELRLEERYGTLWLVYAPTVWVEWSGDKDEDDRRREWGRERQVKRYNRPYTALIKAWSDILCSWERESSLKALGLDNGTDATFELKRLAPYAERKAS